MDPLSISGAPYPGLRSFLRSEFDIFFGRDDHISEMLEKLAETHFLCVTGPSGCGKSSLARTGLFNALEAGFLDGQGSDWIYCDLHPETDPIDRLAASLSKAVVMGESGRDTPDPDDEQAPVVEELGNLFRNHIEYKSSNLTSALDGLTLAEGKPIVILVDQFEEIFRYAQDDPKDASRFVDVLLKTAAARSDIYVVITIRTDELSKCARYSGLTNAINQSQFLTPTLDRFQVQEAIEGPISMFGGEVEEDLSIWLLNGLEDQLDKLPLMQHALRLLYMEERRKAPTGPVQLGLHDFFEAFGISDSVRDSKSRGHDALRTSLSHRLDKIFDGLTDADKQIARGLFCALTTLDAQGRDIRRPVKLGEATEILRCDFESLLRVVSAFKDGTESYLRVAGDHDGIDASDTVDVTHECVLRLWRPLQKDWLLQESASAENIRFLARLAEEREQVAQSWLDRLLGNGLLRGNARTRYSEWWTQWRPNSAWAKRHLTGLSWKDGERSLSPSEMFGRVRAFLASSNSNARYQMIVFGGLAVAIVGTGILFLVSQAQLQAQLREQELWAEIEKQRLVEESLERDIKNQERLAEVSQRAAISARNAVLLALDAARPDPNVADVVAQAEVSAKALRGALDADLSAAELIPGQQHLSSALSYIFELKKFQLGLAREDQFYAAEYTTDGGHILTLSRGLELSLWDLQDNRAPLQTVPLTGAFSRTDGARGRSMALSPDGKTIAVGTQRGAVVLVEGLVPGGADLKITELYSGREKWNVNTIGKLDFSPDGSFLVAASLTGHLHLWQRATDGTWQAMGPFTANNLRQRANGVPVEVASGNEESARNNHIWSAAFSTAGRFIAFGLRSGEVCLTSYDATRVTCSDAGHSEPVKSLSFSPDGGVLVSGGNGDSLRIWRLTQPKSEDAIALPEVALSELQLWQDSDIWDSDFSPDGQFFAATSWDGSTTVYDTSSWRVRRVLRSHEQSPRTVRFSPDGREVLTAALDKTARIWTPFASRLTNYGLAETLSTTDEASDRVLSVALGPEADWIAYTNRETVWAKDAGQNVQPLLRRSGQEALEPQFLASSVQTGALVAAMKAPEVYVWRRGEGEDWSRTNVVLGGGAANLPFEKRAVAMSRDGSVYAVAVSGDGGPGVLVCETTADVCGTDPGQHRAYIAYAREIATDRPSDHDCVRPAFPFEIALDTTGEQLAVGGSDCNARIYDVRSPGSPPTVYSHHVGNITGLDFSEDGSFVAVASADWEGSIWFPEDGRFVELEEHRSSLTDIKVLPSGQFVATTSGDEMLIVWSTDTGEPVNIIDSFTETIYTLDVVETASGTQLAVGTRGGQVEVNRFFATPDKMLDFVDQTLAAIRPGAQ